MAKREALRLSLDMYKPLNLYRYLTVEL